MKPSSVSPNHCSPPVCRICHGIRCEIMLDFGLQPNVLRLLPDPQALDPLHPLRLHRCVDCGFVFIADPMPAEHFYTGVQHATSRYPAPHLPQLVAAIATRFPDPAGTSVYEIGCNDGYLLSLLREKGFTRSGGVEPAQACAAAARQAGFPVEQAYFSLKTAQALLAAGRAPDLVICRQVLEHVEDVRGFMAGLALLAQAGALLLLESPDLTVPSPARDIWEQHLNYFDLPVLAGLLARFGLGIVAQSDLARYYDSWLVWVRAGQGLRPALTDPDRRDFVRRVARSLDALRDAAQGLHSRGTRLCAFGAGARGTILINLSGIGPLLEGVADDTPEKIGKFLPGCHLPLLPFKALEERPPGACLLLPLGNKAAERRVMERMAGLRRRGMFLLELDPEDGDGRPDAPPLVLHAPLSG